MKRFTFLAAILLVFGAGSLWAGPCNMVSGNLVANCGFESVTPDTNMSDTNFGNSLPDGWSVSSPGGGTYALDGTGMFANSGLWAMQFGDGNSTPGEISQSITTVAGEQYSVSFYLDDMPGGVGQMFSASFGGSSVFSLADASSWTGGYALETALVYATGTTSILDFLGGNDPGNWFLDDVSVVDTGLNNIRTGPGPADPSVPEPATLLLLGSGLIAVSRRLSARKG